MSHPLTAGPYEIPEATTFEQVALEDIENPAVRLGASYWQLLRGDRRHPARGELRPRDMAGVLHNMMLVKVLDGGADFEYRIVGNAQVQAYSAQFQGRRISDIAKNWPVFCRTVSSVYTHVFQSDQPFAIRGRAGRDFPDAKFDRSEHVFLPLGDSDDTVDHLLIYSSFAMRPATEGA